MIAMIMAAVLQGGVPPARAPVPAVLVGAAAGVERAAGRGPHGARVRALAGTAAPRPFVAPASSSGTRTLSASRATTTRCASTRPTLEHILPTRLLRVSLATRR